MAGMAETAGFLRAGILFDSRLRDYVRGGLDRSGSFTTDEEDRARVINDETFEDEDFVSKNEDDKGCVIINPALSLATGLFNPSCQLNVCQ